MPMTLPSAISVRDLRVRYGPFEALRGINLEIPANKVTALIGASGSGKSSFLRSLNRMLDTVSGVRTEGEIRIDDENVLHADTDVIRLRRDVGMVFQNPTPFPKSVYHNVSYGLEIQGMRPPRRGWLSLGARPARDIEASEDPLDRAVVRSLREASLWDEVKDRLHQSAYRLSGGQQQRLCIARAIAVRPRILLLDEPCSALDPISTRHIEELLANLKSQYTIVIVTHNLQQARRASDFTGFFHEGRLVEFGATEAVFGGAKEALTRQYVGGEFG